MYANFFGLRCPPFEDRADTQFFYSTPEVDEALAAIEYELRFGTGFAVLIGDAGTGKTLAFRTLLSRLQSEEQAVVLNWPTGGAMDVLRETCKAFGVTLGSLPNSPRQLNRLRRHLTRLTAAGSRAVLFVDQAENLTEQNLTELSAIAELQDERGRLLRIVLAAQPHVRDQFDRPEFARARQLFFTERTLPTMSLADTAGYVRHRLRVSGAADATFFDDRALACIHERSSGVPRLINRIADAAMLAAFGAAENRITASMIDEVTGRATTSIRSMPAPDLLVSTSDAAAPWSRTPISPIRTAETIPPRPIERIPQEHAARWPTFGVASDQAGLATDRLQRAILDGQRVAAQVEHATSAGVTAEHRLNDLMERVARLEEVATRVRRAEESAAEVESRLNTSADRLAESADDIQERTARLMDGIQHAMDAQGRLEGILAQVQDVSSGKNSAPAMFEQSLRRMIQEAGVQAQAVIERIRAVAVEATKKIETTSTDVGDAVQRVQADARRMVEDLSQRARTDMEAGIAQAVRAGQADLDVAQGRIDHLLQRVGPTLADGEGMITTLQRSIDKARALQTDLIDGVVARCRGIVTEETKTLQLSAQQTIEDAESKIDAAIKKASAVITQAERASNIKLDLERVAARAETAAASAAPLAESLQGLVVGAEDKVGRMASHHAAAAGLLDRLAAAERTAHQVREQLTRDQAAAQKTAALLIEQIEKSAHQVREQLQRERAAVQETAASLTERIDRSTQDVWALTAKTESLVKEIGPKQTEIAEQLECLAQASKSAQDVVTDLGRKTEKASGQTLAFNEQYAQAERLVARLTEITPSLDRAKRLLDGLAELARTLEPQARTLRDASASAQGLIESYQQIRVNADGVSKRLEAQCAGAIPRLDAFDKTITDAASRIETIAAHLDDVSAKTAKLAEQVHEATTQPHVVLESVQAQAAQLERVCAAVRKVFAALSQATLDARRQGDDLRTVAADAAGRLNQLAGETGRATGTLREWVEEAVRIQSRLERTIDDAPSIHQTHPAQAVRSVSEYLRENPGASPAANRLAPMETEDSTDAASPRPGPVSSRTQQIARLIDEAKQADALVNS